MNAERSPAANANNCAKSAGFLTLGFFLIERFTGSPRFSNASVMRVVHLCKIARRHKNAFATSVLFVLFLIDEMSDVLIFRPVVGTILAV